MHSEVVFQWALLRPMTNGFNYFLFFVLNLQEFTTRVLFSLFLQRDSGQVKLKFWMVVQLTTSPHLILLLQKSVAVLLHLVVWKAKSFSEGLVATQVRPLTTLNEGNKFFKKNSRNLCCLESCKLICGLSSSGLQTSTNENDPVR